MLQMYFGGEGGRAVVFRPNEHCLYLPESLAALPAWDDGLVQRQMRVRRSQLEPYLDPGRFHSLLPPDLAFEAVQAQCNLPRLEVLYRSAILVALPAGMLTRLMGLVR